jgi:hypothetical protein
MILVLLPYVESVMHVVLCCVGSGSNVTRSRNQHDTQNRYTTWNRKKTPLFSDHYLRNRSTLDIGVLGYIGVL